jgi:FAD/FMN-containing dehydrogenase
LRPHNDVIASLSDKLGPSSVIDDPAQLHRYCHDWSGDMSGRPRCVIRPGDAEQVAQAVAICAEHGVKLVPQGGHTGLVGGAVPSDDGTEVILSLERLNRVRAVDSLNFSLVAEAGCVLQAVRDAAEARDLMFPLSLGAQGSCQIGGNVATNAGGINVLRYGMTRDLVLGLEVVLPDGRLWNGLRSLRKDNTGYDLKQLFIGAEGTLGIVTAAALKLFPRPTQVHTALLGVASAEAAMALFASARRELCDLLSAFELMLRPCLDLTFRAIPEMREPLATPAPAYVLLEASASGLVDLAGPVEQFLADCLETGKIVDGVVATSRAQAQSFWAIRERLVEAQHLRGRHLRTDVSVPVSDIARFIAAADTRLAAALPHAEPIVYGHVGDGNVHYNVLAQPGLNEADARLLFEQAETIIFEEVDRLGGSISAEHGIGRTKRAKFEKRLGEVDADLMRGIRTLLDPSAILSPHRLIMAQAGHAGA